MKKEMLMEAIIRIRTEWLEEFVRTEQAAEQKVRKNSRRRVLLGRWMAVAMNAAALKYFVMASMAIFLGIALFKDVFALIVGSSFRVGIFILGNKRLQEIDPFMLSIFHHEL